MPYGHAICCGTSELKSDNKSEQIPVNIWSKFPI